MALRLPKLRVVLLAPLVLLLIASQVSRIWFGPPEISDGVVLVYRVDVEHPDQPGAPREQALRRTVEVVRRS